MPDEKNPDNQPEPQEDLDSKLNSEPTPFKAKVDDLRASADPTLDLQVNQEGFPGGGGSEPGNDG